MIKYLEKMEDFDIETSKLCLVDFYADWCGPCKMMGQILEEMPENDNLNILKVNVDTFKELALKYGVMSIPTLILFNENKELKKNVGFMSKKQVEKFLE